jgi:hypothetical protein
LSEADNRRTPAPRPRVGGLCTIADVRLEASRLYRATRRGDVPAVDASRMASVLSLISRLIEGSDFEQRLAAIEARLAETKR